MNKEELEIIDSIYGLEPVHDFFGNVVFYKFDKYKLINDDNNARVIERRIIDGKEAVAYGEVTFRLLTGIPKEVALNWIESALNASFKSLRKEQ